MTNVRIEKYFPPPFLGFEVIYGTTVRNIPGASIWDVYLEQHEGIHPRPLGIMQGAVIYSVQHGIGFLRRERRNGRRINSQ